MDCFAYLGNDGIFVSNAWIFRAELNQCDWGVYQEQILKLQLRFKPPRSKIQYPKLGVKF